jgi:hypothetical protein
MIDKKDLLGKIFISHSSVDKPFVRKLRKKLEADGYIVWLDEKELIVGDPLSSSILKAVDDANVFLVIISSAAIKSKWLKYELNSATDKMVQGKCRVIPIIIENVSLPSEVKGLLYSDFTSSFKYGYKQIANALEYEHNEKKKQLSFWHQVNIVTEKVFGAKKYISTSGEYKDFDYDGFDLPFVRKDKIELFVVFESVPDYSKNKKPLDTNWWADYHEVNKKNDYEFLFLVITERPLIFPVNGISAHSARVKRKKLIESENNKQIVVLVDLSSIEMKEWQYHIEIARDELINYATTELQVIAIE